MNTNHISDKTPEYYQQNWVRVPVNWTPEVQLAGGTLQVSDDGALVVRKSGLYEVQYMFDHPLPQGDCDMQKSSSNLYSNLPTAPWTPGEGIFSGKNPRPDVSKYQHHWMPPLNQGEIRSSYRVESSRQPTDNRLKCGCVLQSRIKIMTGAKNIKPATNGRLQHLEAGDRLEMHFWLLVARGTPPGEREVRDQCSLDSTKEHIVLLDNATEEPEPKRIFASAPWIKLTLVAVKPDSDVDVDYVPLGPYQLPVLAADELMPLKLCKELVSLYIKGDGNRVIDHLSFLEGLTNLEELVLVDTRVEDLSPLSALTRLKKLHITGLDLKCGKHVSLTPLASLTALEELSLAGSKSITDAVPIGTLVALKGIDLSASGIVNHTPLQQPGLVIR